MNAYHQERRWAIYDKGLQSYLGKHCWPYAGKDDPVIRTFRTKKKAKEALSDIVSRAAEVRCVTVTIMGLFS